MNKRGQIDFRLPLLVLTGIAAFVVTALVVILTIGVVNQANVFGRAPTVSHTITNETGAYINTTGYTLSGYNNTWVSIVITAVWVNTTDNVPYMLGTGNNTVSAVGIITNQSVPFNATQWNKANVSYTYAHETGPAPLGQLATGNLTGNVTGGVQTISSKLPVVFTVIAIILVLSAIAVLVEVWRRFSSGGGTFG